MAMSPSIRRELHKLREITHFMLSGAGATKRSLIDSDPPRIGALLCYFCKEPLANYADEFVEHGNAIGPKFTAALSIHHVNGNHDDNSELNKALAHTKCHKSYHRTEANKARTKVDPEPFS